MRYLRILALSVATLLGVSSWAVGQDRDGNRPDGDANRDSLSNSPAFRQGKQQGESDALHNRRPNWRSTRWNDERSRHDFEIGYKSGYREAAFEANYGSDQTSGRTDNRGNNDRENGYTDRGSGNGVTDRENSYSNSGDSRNSDASGTRIEPGTMIRVRTNETIDVDRSDNRIYTGTVDQDVRGDNGRMAIPRGSKVELVVRAAPDNDLILDLESVRVNGQRYAIKTDPNRQESRRDDSLVGSIIGAIAGGEARGRAVRIPSDSVLSFRIDRPLDMGVADQGSMREGNHYHDSPDR